MDSQLMPYVCLVGIVCINPLVVGLVVWYFTKYGFPLQWKSRQKISTQRKRSTSIQPAVFDLSEEEA